LRFVEDCEKVAGRAFLEVTQVLLREKQVRFPVLRGRSPLSKAALLTAALALLAGLPACGTKDKKTPQDWLARVVQFSGEVTLSVKEGAPSQPAKAGVVLLAGASISTGPKSTAHLRFRKGGSLKLKPNSVVRFKGGANSLSLGLEQGSVEGSGAEVSGAPITILVGEQRITLGGNSQVLVMREGDGGKLVVSLGAATILRPDGQEEKVIAGQEISIGIKAEPDAGPPDSSPADAGDDSRVVVGDEVVFYLRAAGRGRVFIRTPGSRRFLQVRRGKVVNVEPGTMLRLARRARVIISTNKDGKGGASYRGPAQLVVREGPVGRDGKRTVRLESVGKALTITASGARGKVGPKFTVENVAVSTRVAYKRVDVRVQKEKNRSVLMVRHGVATLKEKGGKITKLEAGQSAVISNGKVSNPRTPAKAGLQVKRSGSARLFTPRRRMPITFAWKSDWKEAVLEVSRNRKFRKPIFSDAVTRSWVTLPQVRRGTLYWRVRPISPDGKLGAGIKGRLSLLVDTSYRVLKIRPPHNLINQSYGNTTVYYQNALPKFAFRWTAVEGAVRYDWKIFREANLAKPVLTNKTAKTDLELRQGRLGEGRYSWYVVARNSKGKLLKGTKERKLIIRYDNATPNLQIIAPRNMMRVSGNSVEVRGVTFKGSLVFINGKAAELDVTYRFRQTVALKPGINSITFRVDDKRRGSSLYQRTVIRK